MQRFGRLLQKAALVLAGIVLFIVSLIGFSARWCFTTWGDLDVDEIIFQLQAPLEGTGNGMITEYIIKGALPAVLLTVLYIVIVVIVFRIKKEKAGWITFAVTMVLSLAAAVVVKQYIWNRLNVDQWVKGQKNESTFIEENYADPEKTQITFPEKKRNLIYIYLESMETTYADQDSGGAFPSNVIPELTELAMESEDFSGSDNKLNGGIVYPGSTNTTSALFAHSTGLPIKVDIGNNNMDTQHSFFPKVTSIGDILKKEGYRQVFLLGSNAAFGGRRLYFEDHGDFEIRDYNYAKDKGWIEPDYKVFWGFEDEKLFQFAKDTLEELAGGGEPFNLTLLTVDTHFEDGYVCRLCEDGFGDNQYANVMACSSRQVSDFVKWVRQQDFYEDTAIVLTGDHTTMDRDFCKEVDKAYQRRTYTAFINAASERDDPDTARTYSTLDTLPTTLAAMGVDIEGNRLALGTNLFSGRKTLTEEFGVSAVRDELSRRSSFLHELEELDMKSDELVNRIRREMNNSVSVRNWNPETGSLDIAVEAPISDLSLDYIEVKYKGKTEKKAQTVRLEREAGKIRTFIGSLDLSDWKEPEGTLYVNLILEDGTVYKDVKMMSIGELLDQEPE